jgi:malonyl CoA-acyl carrier protein transacylase
MNKSLVAAAILLLSCCIGRAQDKPSAHVVIAGTPEQIKKAALNMFARDGFTLESDAAAQLRVSKPFSAEEMATYNTAHWTNQPMANCRHVQVLSLSPTDGVVTVGVATEIACNPSAGKWIHLRTGDEKESEWMQNSLDTLKARVEENTKRR